jgi:hypothetical protein
MSKISVTVIKTNASKDGKHYCVKVGDNPGFGLWYSTKAEATKMATSIRKDLKVHGK